MSFLSSPPLPERCPSPPPHQCLPFPLCLSLLFLLFSLSALVALAAHAARTALVIVAAVAAGAALSMLGAFGRATFATLPVFLSVGCSCSLEVLFPYGDQHGTPYFTHDDLLIDDPTVFITQLSVSATVHAEPSSTATPHS